MADAELVVDDQITTVPAAIAQANMASMERLDAAVAEIEKQAQDFKCLTASDYAAGGAAVTRIRSLDGLYERMFQPLKRWWDAEKKKVLDDEKARRGKLDIAKKTIGDKMLEWKMAEDARLEKIRREQEALAEKRAEEERLAVAEQLAARAKETGNQTLAQEAVDLLDRPLDIAPVTIGTTVPKVAGVKTVQQKMVVGKSRYAGIKKAAGHRRLTDKEWEQAQEIKGDDLRDLIICVAASAICYEMDAPPEVKKWLSQFAVRSADVQALEPNGKWLKAEASQRGDAFKIGGVEVVQKERLG